MIPLVTHRCPSKNSRNGCNGASDSQSRTNRMQATARGWSVVLMVVICSPSPDPKRYAKGNP